MTKKIAVVGCSFSAFWQGDDTARGINYDVKTWSHHLLENYDVTIDSFAQCGTSMGYLNYCLNWINNHPDLEYDLIIGNIPPLSRDWYFGFNEKMDEITEYRKLLDTDSWFNSTPVTGFFESAQVHERIKVYDIDPLIICHSHKEVVDVQGANKHMLGQEERDYLAQFTEHTQNNFILNHRKNLQYIQTAREYYAKILPFTFWHHVSNYFTDPEKTFKDGKVDYDKISKHNIMHEQCAWHFFKKDHKKYLIDIAHFNTLGHEQLLEKYILTDNKINSILNE